MRLAPILPLLLLALTGPVAEGSGLVAIYPYAMRLTESENKPIVLQIPEAFRYGSSQSAVRTYGINILTFYPSFTSPHDPRNAPFIDGCKGDCNGRMLIGIENDSFAIHNLKRTGHDYPNRGDFYVHFFLEHQIVPNGSRITELGPQHGFDSGRQVEFPLGNTGPQTYQYLFHLSPDRLHYDLAAECSINRRAKVCELHFSLTCSSGVDISIVGIEMSRVDQFFKIKDKTDKFISSMMRVPACS